MRMRTADVDLETASRLFHALSDETRLQIVRLLAGGERCVCELTDALGQIKELVKGDKSPDGAS